MNISRTGQVTAAAACAATLGLAALAASASASASQPGASHAASAGEVPRSFGCTSRAPAFHGSIPAHFKSAGINIRTGPHASCTSRGLGYKSNTVRVWCYQANSPSVIWYYLNDRTTGKRGWSRSLYVTITAGGPTPCTAE